MAHSNSICPVCDKGTLTKAAYSDQFKHGRYSVTVDGLEGYLCDTCDSEPISPPQIRRNQCKIADAKRRRDGLLTSSEILNIREKLGLTQKDAAKVFGGGANAFSKYERGDVLQSISMDKLLRLAAGSPHIIRQLQNEASPRQYTDNVSYKKQTDTKPLSINIKMRQFEKSRYSDWTPERNLAA